MINLIKVKSTNIDRIGYDKDNKTLYVLFKGQATYTYQDVPEDIYNEFLKAESIGKFFHTNINKKFKFEKVK